MTPRPGPRNLITDVAGLRVGHAQDDRARTGVTVLLADGRATAAVAVTGGAPGTRETDLLDPANMVEGIDALVLSGGSVFGLAAAEAVVAWCAAAGRGLVHPASPHVLPIVPAAILFDLGNGGDKAWGAEPPYRALGRAAAEAAAACDGAVALGNAGAGYGALAGAYKGGLGSASQCLDDGLMVGALVAANPVGSPARPDTGALWAAPFELAGEMGGQGPGAGGGVAGLPPDMKGAPRLGANTTLAVVATDAALTKAEAARVARMAHDGLARAIRPVHTPFDGDVVFAVATGRRPLAPEGAAGVMRVGAAAADVLARAVGRAVWSAETLGPHESWRSRHGGAGGSGGG